MKKITFLLFAITIAINAFSQGIVINFEPVAGGDPIDSIRVYDMTDYTSALLVGDQDLYLTPVGINPDLSETINGVLYPNPSSEKTTLSFSTIQNGKAAISVYNSAGLELLKRNYILSEGNHSFDINLPQSGLYYISVIEGNNNICYKAIYTGTENRKADIQYIGIQSINSKLQSSVLKDVTDNHLPHFSDGNVLHYICYSGDTKTTIIGDSPKKSKTIEVEFWECKVGDDYYKVVQMGDQVWMAENVKYLPSVVGKDDYSNTEERYYVYKYDGTNVEEAKATNSYQIYGSLLNLPAAEANAPRGWHLPTDNDWETLRTFLNNDWGTTGMAGQYLKSTNYWIAEGAGVGEDPYAFSLQPAGRCQSGDCIGETGYAFVWSSTPASAEMGHKYFVFHTEMNLHDSECPFSSGQSVRYIKD